LTESLLQIIYPHYTRPLPSMTTVKFIPSLINVPPSGHLIPKGTRLLTPPVNSNKVVFQTTQEVRLLPLQVTGAGFTLPYNPGSGALGGLKIQLRPANNLTLEK
jgi:type VI secretion system protein ImpG